MPSTHLSVVLRLHDSVGLDYWCLKLDPEHGRPDLRPERPWEEVAVGDHVIADDGTVYEVDRLVPIEQSFRAEPSEGVLPACREALSALAGTSFEAYVAAIAR